MEQSDIDKLLALRSAWDKFKAVKVEKSQKDYDDFYTVFWSYGIEGHMDIVQFNKVMCIQLLREQYTMHGTCDKCKGYDAEPPCRVNWGASSCAVVDNKLNPDMWYYILLKGLRMGLRPPKISDKSNSKIVESLRGNRDTFVVHDNKFSSICPPGHGYYFDYFIPIEDKKPFDLTWVP